MRDAGGSARPGTAGGRHPLRGRRGDPEQPVAVPGLSGRGGGDRRRPGCAVFETRFAANDWRGSWRNGIYPFPHYHSTAHEVLGIARGEAKVRFGGAHGRVLTVRAGDVVVIPAGVGHQNLGASPELLVVGAYPGGADWDLCYGKPDERPRVLKNIARVQLPAADPVYGEDGPLMEHWRGA